MKKLNFLSLAVPMSILFLSVGCDKIKDALDITFTTNEIEITFTVNPAPAGDYTSTQQVVQSDLKQQIEDNGGDASKIRSIKIEECKFEVVTPDRTFKEFQSANLYLNTTKIAWVDNIPESSTSETMTFTQDNLDSFLTDETYTGVAKGVLDQELTTAITIKAKIKYSVKVSAL